MEIESPTNQSKQRLSEQYLEDWKNLEDPNYFSKRYNSLSNDSRQIGYEFKPSTLVQKDPAVSKNLQNVRPLDSSTANNSSPVEDDRMRGWDNIKKPVRVIEPSARIIEPSVRITESKMEPRREITRPQSPSKAVIKLAVRQILPTNGRSIVTSSPKPPPPKNTRSVEVKTTAKNPERVVVKGTEFKDSRQIVLDKPRRIVAQKSGRRFVAGQ
eukprot:Platyproteum_vivax@DN10381_c0_g1_i1.p1